MVAMFKKGAVMYSRFLSGAVLLALPACGGISESDLPKQVAPRTESNAVERPPTPEQVANQTQAATIAYVSDAGRFNVISRIRIIPGTDSEPVAELAVSGGNASGTMTMGMNLPLSADQTASLLRGETVPVSNDSLLGYGLPAGQVMRKINSMSLARAATEMWLLTLQLNSGVLRTSTAPSDLGTATEALFVGEFAVECLAPGPAGHEDFVREDSDGRSEFCGGAIQQLGVKSLVK